MTCQSIVTILTELLDDTNDSEDNSDSDDVHQSFYYSLELLWILWKDNGPTKTAAKKLNCITREHVKYILSNISSDPISPVEIAVTIDSGLKGLW